MQSQKQEDLHFIQQREDFETRISVADAQLESMDADIEKIQKSQKDNKTRLKVVCKPKSDHLKELVAEKEKLEALCREQEMKIQLN